MVSTDAVRAEYVRRQRAAEAEDRRLDGHSALLGNGRVVLLLVAVVVVWRAWGGQPWNLHALLGVLFVASVVWQARVDRSREAHRRRAALYLRSLARLDGKWIEFASEGRHLASPDHPYAYDLDVVGKGSLFQLVDTTRTAQGEATLGRWLLAPAPVAELRDRRAAAEALAADLDARELLALPAFEPGLARIDERPLISWAEGPPLLVVARWEALLATVLPFVTTALLVGLRLGHVPVSPVLVAVSIHLVLLVRARRGVSQVAILAEETEKSLTRLLPLLEAAAQLPAATPRIARLRESLAGAVQATGALRRRVTVFQSRGNLIVAIVAPLLLWDIHAARLLQRWQARTGPKMRAWFEALGELEALSALGTYTAEHPADPWAEVEDGPLVFEASAAGHPLLREEQCVRNDVALAGPGTALLVTGSNMSGKSTLLRAVGLNVVLALAGLPVRAKRLRVSVLQVATAMRTADSLLDGASFFMAEVRRLKRVVDLAHAGPVLFLLDEILQGTNTRERSLGARGVVAHLLSSGAGGLVSTHDLSLVQLGETLGGRLAYAHFTDQVDGDRMTFDYRMRPGVVQTSNALRVMRAVGLDVEIPAEPPPVH